MPASGACSSRASPTGKARPRFTRQGHAYTPAKTVHAENRIYLAWVEAGQPRLPDGPLQMTVIAAMERPAVHYRKDGSLSAAGTRATFPTRKPDADNLLKLAADALNGHAYRDDAQIVAATVLKDWTEHGEPPYLEIVVGPAR